MITKPPSHFSAFPGVIRALHFFHVFAAIECEYTSVSTHELDKREIPVFTVRSYLSEPLLEALQKLCIAHQLSLSVAESCTGGLLSALLTHLSGSSGYFLGGVVSYANSLKTGYLNVPCEVLATEGAVSEAVAGLMARSVQASTQSSASLAITGIAGPGGGSEAKPVGTVCFGFCVGKELLTETRQFAGTREEIRGQACAYVLGRLFALLTQTLPHGA